MPVRRHHEKSRNGCIQCKARKVKCDEIKPNCSGCVKRSAICSFENSSSALIFVSEFGGIESDSPKPNDSSAASGSRASVSSPSTAAATPGSVDWRMLAAGPELQARTNNAFNASELDNLRLMRHYSLHTYKVISGSTSQLPLFRDIIPDLAFDHDYLLHGILMIAALHLALIDPSSTSTPTPGICIDPSAAAPPPPEPTSRLAQTNPLSASPAALALHHHTVALGLFRNNIANVTAANIQPLFAFSCILAVYAFGYPRTSSAPIDTLPEVIHTYTLLRGTAAIVRSGTEMLASSPLRALLFPQPSDPDAPLAPRIQAALAGLGARNEAVFGAPADTAVREAYASAIGVLRYSFLLASEAPGQQFMAIPFAILIPDEAAARMRAGDPMALCILAHHAVLLHWLGMHVFMKGWGRKTVEGVWREVDEEWRAWLWWPMEEVAL